MNKRKTLVFATPAAILAALAFATPVFAWHINSTCSNSQWIVGIPNESWATGTTATFDFNQGPDATLGKGQATTAPAAATSVVVTFNNSAERLTGSRPAGCVVVVQAIPTTTTTTTTVAPTTTAAPVIEAVASSSVQVVTLETPAPVVVAVADPPVPQPQGVSAAFTQTLPATGAGDTLLWWAAGLVAAGAVAMLMTRRPTS